MHDYDNHCHFDQSNPSSWHDVMTFPNHVIVLRALAFSSGWLVALILSRRESSENKSNDKPFL